MEGEINSKEAKKTLYFPNIQLKDILLNLLKVVPFFLCIQNQN